MIDMLKLNKVILLYDTGIVGKYSFEVKLCLRRVYTRAFIYAHICSCENVFKHLLPFASIEQLGERKTEDLEALCSIHS